MKLNLGDALEWIAGAIAIVAVADGTGKSWPAWALAAVFVGYEAQCYAKRPIALPKLSGIRVAYRDFMRREDAKRAAREQS